MLNMIDYLKLEYDLEPFYDYEAEQKYREKTDKIEKILFYIYWFSLVLIGIMYYFIFKQINMEFSVVLVFSALGLIILYMVFFSIICPEKDFQGSNYETEENLNKVSEFGIQNITNFKENVDLLKRKTKYMFLDDEKIKATEEYSANEVYINKILNIFYGTDKTDLEKQDIEFLELLK